MNRDRSLVRDKARRIADDASRMPRHVSQISVWPIGAVLLIVEIVGLAALWWFSGRDEMVLIACAIGVAASMLMLLAFARRARTENAASARDRHRAATESSEQIELLRSQQSEQRLIQESMSTGMMALDLQQRVLSINRAAQRLLNINESGAKGKPLRESLQEPKLNRFVSQLISEGRQASAEFSLVGRSGVTVQALGEPLRNAENKSIGLLILLTDVTRLRRLETMRSDFAANVSHELRTPITNIKGYVETLLDVGVSDAEQAARFLAIINRNTQRLALIIEDLLALARLERADAMDELVRAPTPVRLVAEAVVAQFEKARSEKQIAIETDMPRDLEINVNSQLIEQALGNLLSNAIKYSPPNTKVTIRALLNRRGEVELIVADQGPGIAREHLPRLFERFYRVDRARSREMGGTGLGLAIVKHIALVHGGRVEVESEVGRGSTFRLILPPLAA